MKLWEVIPVLFAVLFVTTYCTAVVVFVGGFASIVGLITMSSRRLQRICMYGADTFWGHLCILVEKWGRAKVKLSGMLDSSSFHDMK